MTLRTSGPVSRGFTLVEAVVLIGLIGILASISAPRFLSVTEFDGAQAHRRALSDLRFAQRLAAASGCPVQVDFDAASYQLRQRSGCRSGAFTREVEDPASRTAPFLVSLPPGASLTSDVDPIVFDTRGRVTDSAGVVRDASILIEGRPLQAIGESGYVRVP